MKYNVEREESVKQMKKFLKNNSREDFTMC